ncbi:UvrD-helicase domain-containing protein, partial [Halosegnis longus]|uniref:UvrD-helicase domain-containing protein n=1 Tax=Halosegnis longus TaxID=2216012 RepID=UPI00129ECE9C
MIDEERLEPEQQTAATTLDRNVSVRAGAGTGKTTTLTARYMQILEQRVAALPTADESARLAAAEAIPEQILTTTFTERAADDLVESVREEILSRLSAADSGPEFRTWRAVADGLDDAYIHTLHGLCHRLLSEHAVGATTTPTVDAETPLGRYGMTYDGLDIGFEVAEEGDATALQEAAVAAVFRDPEAPDAVERLARRFPRETLAEMLTDFLAFTPRATTYEWLSTMDACTSAADYRDRVAAQYFDTEDSGLSLARLETITPAVIEHGQTMVAAFEALPAEAEAELHGNTESWMLNNVAGALGEYADPSADLSSLSTAERREMAIGVLAAVISSSSGTVYEALRPEGGIADEYPESSLGLYADALESLFAYAQEGAWDAIPEQPFQTAELTYPDVQAFATLATEAFTAYTERKREENVVDYGDLIALTNHFLASISPTARRELGFMSESGESPQEAYVMVDEFQDTNPEQWAIIKQLTCEEPAEPTATNLFIVGDAKQSIYRFRGADVSVFADGEATLKAANDAAGYSTAQPPLATNFRTLQRPLEAINGLFERIFVGRPRDGEPWYAERDGKPADFEARSEPLRAGRTNPHGVTSAVEYIPVPTDAKLQETLLPDVATHMLTQGSDEPARLEASVVATRIAELLTGDTTVYESVSADDPEYAELAATQTEPIERARSARPGDVAVLLRSRSELAAYERALRRAEIPHTVVKGQGFFETPEVETLCNLLRVIADPTDNRALYAVLRSPLFGQPDDSLAQLAVAGRDDQAGADGDDVELWQALQAADGEEWAAIARTLTMLREAAGTDPDVDGRQVDSWGAVVELALRETGYLAAIGADERGETAMVNVERFRDRVDAIADGDQHSLSGVIRQLEHQQERAEHDPEANVVSFADAEEDTDAGSVQLLTIHEAKGDEFPIVVVPGMHRKFTQAGGARLGAQQAEFETVPTGEDERVPVFGLKGPTPSDRFRTQQTLSRATAARQRRHEERAEEKRTLYVACTRARDHLVLTGRHATGSDSEYPGEMAEPSPTDAKAWRDWVQAALFEADEEADGDGPAAVFDALAADGEYRRTLPYPGPDGQETGTITIRQPPAESVELSNETQPTVDLSGYEPPPTQEATPTIQLSPSQCSGLAAGTASLAWLDDQTIGVVEEDHVPEHDRGAGQSAGGGRDIPGGVSAAAYGTLVHRLVEMAPPEEAVERIVRQVLAGETAADVEAVDIAAVATAAMADADAAVQGLESLVTPAVQSHHAEFGIDAELEELVSGARVAMRGEIDRLLVSDDAYHIVDFKTDRWGEESIDEFVQGRATHHEPQMAAYAVGLQALDPSRDVRATIVLTAADGA